MKEYFSGVTSLTLTSFDQSLNQQCPDLDDTAAYLLELLDLRLLKHGEDVGASLLSSPLSLV